MHAARTYLDLGVQQGALLQALIEQTHLFDGVAADAVGIVVFAEQQAAQQSGILKTRGSLTLQHRGGRGKDLRLQWETRTIRHTLREGARMCAFIDVNVIMFCSLVSFVIHHVEKLKHVQNNDCI